MKSKYVIKIFLQQRQIYIKVYMVLKRNKKEKYIGGIMTSEIILGLMGGLGLFLYGMEMMSAGLEKVAGAKMRSILAACTKNQFIGLLVGTLVTMIIQSSSATTVLVVSFVNAKLMNLTQAVGIILGANIGTTITGQLLALNLTAIAPIFVIIGVCLIMFSKNPTIKRSAEVLLGFGMLFVGMDMMSNAMDGLKTMPSVVNTLASLQHPFMGIFVGFVITAVLQSSSATIGIVMVLASQELIGLPISFFIILGCNIGSCVTALLASLNGKKDAKRAALVHLIVNIIGTIINAIILWLFMDRILEFLNLITRNVPNVAVNGINDKLAKDVANANTLLKMIQVFLVFPFTNWIVKLTQKLVPGVDEKVDRHHLKYIGEHTLYSPTTAVPQATKEIVRMGMIAFENMDLAIDGMFEKDNEKLDKVYEVENDINYMSEAITKYLVQVNQISLPVKDRQTLGALFHVVSDVERIGDHAENLADFAKKMIEKDIVFSESGEKEFREMHILTKQLLEYSMEMFSKKSEEHLKEILEIENKIDKMEKKLQKNHVKRLTQNECTPEAGMIFSDMISNLERIADHATNIAFSILEEDKDESELEMELLGSGIRY